MAPLDILGNYGTFWGYLTALLIGIGFGIALEMSGFGDSRRLAAQFYFTEMRVLKVMFTAIIVAMTLIFLTSSLGLLDFSKVFVNPTYLFPGIIGGLIMGVGFIVGGFCPGTSLVAMSTGKIDGMFFVGGVLFGVFTFGESVASFENFYNSYYMGRFTLSEWLGVDAGVAVVLVLLMAFAMFYGSELLEQKFGEKKAWKNINLKPYKKGTLIAGSLLLLTGVITMAIGQPSIERRWSWKSAVESKRLESREVFIHPGELYEVMNNALLYKNLIDVRSESDYNIFHLEDAEHLTLNDLTKTDVVKKFLDASANTVNIIISNDEKTAVEAFKIMRAQNIINLYILSGGINNWLDTFTIDKSIAVREDVKAKKDEDALRYAFTRAVGETVYPANPRVRHGHGLPELKFEKKVKMKTKKTISGGCG